MAVDAFGSSYLLNLSQIEFCRGNQKVIIRARIPYNQLIKNNRVTLKLESQTQTMLDFQTVPNGSF